MSRAKVEDRPCLYNNGVSAVECAGIRCKTCGWYPEEHKRRVALLRWREEANQLQNGPLIVKRRNT